jgi:hypothetical protein
MSNREISQANHKAHFTSSELFLAYDATLEALSTALDFRNGEAKGHTQRVTEMALSLAKALGMNDMELVHIRRGAALGRSCLRLRRHPPAGPRASDHASGARADRYRSRCQVYVRERNWPGCA